MAQPILFFFDVDNKDNYSLINFGVVDFCECQSTEMMSFDAKYTFSINPSPSIQWNLVIKRSDITKPSL